MSNGRINRGRARATRPENNKIYILICAGTSSRPTSKESRELRDRTENERERTKKGEGGGERLSCPRGCEQRAGGTKREQKLSATRASRQICE